MTARIVRARVEPVAADEDESDDTVGSNVIAMPAVAKAPIVEQPRHVEQVTQRRQAMRQMSLFD